jgi:hypothetical protein
LPFFKNNKEDFANELEVDAEEFEVRVILKTIITSGESFQVGGELESKQFITFETPDKERIAIQVPLYDYLKILEGDRGVLTVADDDYQLDTDDYSFISFEINVG